MNQNRNRGFTIVELLIVIVVIAILVAVSVVAYRGIQARARDSQRLSDITSIAKALEVYKAQYGSYPVAVGNSVGGWEISSNPNGNQPFLKSLVDAGIVSQVPVDPVNTGDMTSATSRIYYYFRYPAGSYGCATAFYVLGVMSAETGSVSTRSPKGECGIYTNGPGSWYKLAKDTYY